MRFIMMKIRAVLAYLVTWTEGDIIFEIESVQC